MSPSSPRNMRLHIGLFGRRNVGKSSLINAIARQDVAIVSPEAGTTTDPVEKPMELLPIGPVVFIDTAGIDDGGALGERRVERTRRVFDRTDVGVIVLAGDGWGALEEGILAELQNRGAAVVVAMARIDADPPDQQLTQRLADRGLAVVQTSAATGAGLADLRAAFLAAAPADYFDSRRIVADLVPPGELAVLVVPIDKEAPKGRLILPQAQAIRDLLDGDACCLVVKDRELPGALARLAAPPALVVTDSQAFREVAAVTPPGVPLTSFSILFARFQGDLAELARGAAAIGGLRPDARVLVAEGCSHHPVGEDIGRVKIPRWLREHTGQTIEFDTVAGRDFPVDVSPFDLVVHCGNCMGNRREMLSRILRCRQAGVPITNYGLTIAVSLGILERALELFPAALAAWRDASGADRSRSRPARVTPGRT